MRIPSFAAAVLAIAISAPAAAASLAAYGRLPAIALVDLSSDGERLAFVADVHDRRSVVAYDLATGKTLAQADIGQVKVRGLNWAGPRSVVVTVSAAASLRDYGVDLSEWSTVQVLDVVSKRVDQPLRRQPNLVGGLAGAPIVREPAEGAALLLTARRESGGINAALFRVDPVTNRANLLLEASQRVRDWAVTPAGEVVARSLFHAESGTFEIQRTKGAGWREAYRASTGFGQPRLIGFGRNGSDLLITAPDSDGQFKLAELTADDTLRPLPVPPNAAQLIFNRETLALAALGYDGESPSYRFFDKALAARWSAVLPLFPASRLQLLEADAAMDRLVVHVQSATDPGSYHLVDFRSGEARATAIGSAYPDLKPADLAEVRPVAFKAADGLALDGYLTLPRGKPERNLPLIVLVHGGPQAHDRPGFDWWSQGLASRGYAVLQVNFRGSDHKGRAFRDAGFGEWGGKMQTDLSDGVRHLAAQGVIDPKRVCIMGASYGGYAAMAGPTLDRGVYRCAVSVSGVSDLKAQLAEERDDGDAARVRYWRRFMGVDKDPTLAERRSPARLAAQADAPILLMHGQDDSVVPFEQSRRMADALKAAGKPHQLITLETEDHWLSREATRQRMLIEAVAFVEKHNPPN